MKSLDIRFTVIAGAFVMMGLVADVLPHPALGPGLIQSWLSATFPEDESNNPQIIEHDPLLHLGQTEQSLDK